MSKIRNSEFANPGKNPGGGRTVSRFLTGFVVTLFFAPFSFGAPELSEFMADNRYALDDEDGDSEDWIELHNPGRSPVSLGGYFLTDDPLDLTKWQIPAFTLSSGEHLVVFASGKDRTDQVGEWHTNFRLARNGEYLAPVAPDGASLITEFSAYPFQP